MFCQDHFHIVVQDVAMFNCSCHVFVSPNPLLLLLVLQNGFCVSESSLH